MHVSSNQNCMEEGSRLGRDSYPLAGQEVLGIFINVVSVVFKSF